jgi:hypothetical protein
MWAWVGRRCRFTEASGRCRFTEGRTRGGSLPLTALIVVKIFAVRPCSSSLLKTLFLYLFFSIELCFSSLFKTLFLHYYVP